MSIFIDGRNIPESRKKHRKSFFLFKTQRNRKFCIYLQRNPTGVIVMKIPESQLKMIIMKKLIVLSAAVTMILSSCGGGGSSLKTDLDSVAYAMGMDFGAYVKNMDTTNQLNLNINVVTAGVKDAYNGKTKIVSDSAYSILSQYFSVTIPEKKKAEGIAWLAEIEKTTPNIQKTESGILYEILEPGTTKPAATDTVNVNYEGKLRTGKSFDSSYERGEPAKFSLDRVIAGWSEGIQLVGEGGKIRLWIPSDLAYGPMGVQGMIGPNEPLMFDVELLEIIPGPAVVESAE